MGIFSGLSAKNFQFPGQGESVKERGALHIAVLEEDAEQLEFLLSYNASPDARDANGHTPFHYAIATKDIPTAQRLLDAGANINIRDWKRRTILGVLTSPKLPKLNINPNGPSLEERIQFLRDNGAAI